MCVCIPRWDSEKEIEDQFSNYQRLMDFMNSQPQMKINVYTVHSIISRAQLLLSATIPGTVCDPLHIFHSSPEQFVGVSSHRGG